MTDPLLAVSIAIGAVAVVLIIFDLRADSGAARSTLRYRPDRGAINPSRPRARVVSGVRSGSDAMARRELVDPNPGAMRYVRGDERGRFKEVDDVGRSSAQDQKRQAKSTSKRRQGDKGDRKS